MNLKYGIDAVGDPVVFNAIEAWTCKAKRWQRTGLLDAQLTVVEMHLDSWRVAFGMLPRLPTDAFDGRGLI